MDGVEIFGLGYIFLALGAGGIAVLCGCALGRAAEVVMNFFRRRKR